MASKKTPSKKTTTSTKAAQAPVRGTKPTLAVDNLPRLIETEAELKKWLKKGYMVHAESDSLKEQQNLDLMYKDEDTVHSLVAWPAYVNLVAGKDPLFRQRSLLTDAYAESMYLVFRDDHWTYHRELETAHSKLHQKTVQIEEALKIKPLTWVEVKESFGVNRVVLILSKPQNAKSKGKADMYFEALDTKENEQFPVTTVFYKDIVRVLYPIYIVPTVLWTPDPDVPVKTSKSKAIPVPTPSPAPSKSKSKSKAVANTAAPMHEKGGETSRRPQLRELHEAVREQLAAFKLAVDTAPRHPKRIGDEVHYYLADIPKSARRSAFTDLEHVLSKNLSRKDVKQVHVVPSASGWPSKVVVGVAV